MKHPTTGAVVPMRRIDIGETLQQGDLVREGNTLLLGSGVAGKQLANGMFDWFRVVNVKGADDGKKVV
jgi:hypothetical protein